MSTKDYRFIESVRNEKISNVEGALQTGENVNQRDLVSLKLLKFLQIQ